MKTDPEIFEAVIIKAGQPDRNGNTISVEALKKIADDKYLFYDEGKRALVFRGPLPFKERRELQEAWANFMRYRVIPAGARYAGWRLKRYVFRRYKIPRADMEPLYIKLDNP